MLHPQKRTWRAVLLNVRLVPILLQKFVASIREA